MVRIAELGLRVNDPEGALAFYRDTLGFAFHHSEPGVVFLEIGPLESPLGEAGHPQLLALFDRGRVADASVSTFDHVAFEIPDHDYDKQLDRFSQMNMVIWERSWPETLLWNGRSFFIRDPEGNVIEFIAANLRRAP